MPLKHSLYANGENGPKEAIDKVTPLLGMWKLKMLGFAESENVHGSIGVIRTEDGIALRGESNNAKYYIYGIGRVKNDVLLLDFSVKKRGQYSSKYRLFSKGKAELSITSDAKKVEGNFYIVQAEPKPSAKNQLDIKGNLVLDKIYIPMELLKTVR